MGTRASTKQMKAQPSKKTAESTENSRAVNYLLKIKTYIYNDYLPPVSLPFRLSNLQVVAYAVDTSRGEHFRRTGYHV